MLFPLYHGQTKMMLSYYQNKSNSKEQFSESELWVAGMESGIETE